MARRPKPSRKPAFPLFVEQLEDRSGPTNFGMGEALLVGSGAFLLPPPVRPSVPTPDPAPAPYADMPRPYTELIGIVTPGELDPACDAPAVDADADNSACVPANTA